MRIHEILAAVGRGQPGLELLAVFSAQLLKSFLRLLITERREEGLAVLFGVEPDSRVNSPANSQEPFDAVHLSRIGGLDFQVSLGNGLIELLKPFERVNAHL